MKEHQYSRIRAAVVGALLLLPAAYSPVATSADVSKPTESSAIITIPVTLINQQNTCKVTFEGATVSGGGTYTFQATLLKGQEQTHPPFQAVVTCEENSAVKTALKVRPATGFQGSGDNAGLYREDDLTAKSGELWLMHDGQKVPMGSNAGGTSPAEFCVGMASDTVRNSCLLTPKTSILPTAQGGPVTTTLTFDVAYP
ncbi:Uncharacterised protein [Escherichia coli]|uniref:hypothetical protein n=1 Tax=Escherichia coli TaxID=562 RepID=UPI001919D86D|nr:hypothetical protein [Escherichia coli]CAD5758900.1 Uncharacterised protein [Escherichia coli]